MKPLPGPPGRTNHQQIIVPPASPGNPSLMFLVPEDWTPMQRNHLRDMTMAAQTFGKPLLIPDTVRVYQLIQGQWREISTESKTLTEELYATKHDPI